MTISSMIVEAVQAFSTRGMDGAEQAIAMMRLRAHQEEALVGITDRDAIPRIRKTMALAGVRVSAYQILENTPTTNDLCMMDCVVVATESAAPLPNSATLGDGLSIAWPDHDLREDQWLRVAERYANAGDEPK